MFGPWVLKGPSLYKGSLGVGVRVSQYLIIFNDDLSYKHFIKDLCCNFQTSFYPGLHVPVSPEIPGASTFFLQHVNREHTSR